MIEVYLHFERFGGHTEELFLDETRATRGNDLCVCEAAEGYLHGQRVPMFRGSQATGVGSYLRYPGQDVDRGQLI